MTVSRGLVGAVIAMLVVDVGLRIARRTGQGADLPALPGFDVALVRELRLGRVDAPTLIEKADGSWRIRAPIEADADPVEVEAIVGKLSGGIHPDLALPPDPEGYGLSGGQEIRVDVRAAQGELLSVVVGADAGGGGTFVRLPNDDTVYRAPIGGRSLYDRPVRTLLDRRIASCAPERIERIELPGLDARRTAQGWVGGGARLDEVAVAQLVRRLCTLRGAESAAAERVARWDATVVLHGDGDPVTLEFGHNDDLRYARRGDAVWRITADLGVDLVERLRDPATFEDKTLWTANDLVSVGYRGDGIDGELVREGTSWVVRLPANVDLDPTRVQAAVGWLLRPRVVRWSSEERAFSPRASLTVRDANGRAHVLEVGDSDAGGVAVRTADRPGRIGRVDPTIVREIKAIFGG